MNPDPIIANRQPNTHAHKNMKTTESKPTLEQMPAPPPDAEFSLAKVDTVCLPHPYCITPKHVAWAADHWGGMLGVDAIRDAEKHGARCDICRQKAGAYGNILTYDQHESQVTLFIRVEQNQDLNAVPGLHAYLFKNKQTFMDLGIQGFAFPT